MISVPVRRRRILTLKLPERAAADNEHGIVGLVDANPVSGNNAQDGAKAEPLSNFRFGNCSASYDESKQAGASRPIGMDRCCEFALIGCTDDSAMLTRGVEQVVYSSPAGALLIRS
jgi:hypothetical protein